MAKDTTVTKSRFIEYLQCPKLAWLHEHRPEVLHLGEDAKDRMAIGREVGEIAKALFGDKYVDISKLVKGRDSIHEAVRITKQEIEKKTPVICEAAFAEKCFYCAVDILLYHPIDDSWEIVEVKSSTKPDKEVYAFDVAYQLKILRDCGIRVSNVYIATINRDYVYDGLLDIHKLFSIRKVTEKAEQVIKDLGSEFMFAYAMLNVANEPEAEIGSACRWPYKCPCWDYCAKGIPEEDLITQYPECIDHEAIRDFLKALHYPLYFLDFETVQPVIPRYIGTRPYDQIPFMYSLHYIKEERAPLLHTDYLAEAGSDPRRALAEQLVVDIPSGACVTAYNKAFECTRIKELAAQFPDLADHLLETKDSIVDLMYPFQRHYYYLKAMHGSYSIKAVLPALFPNAPGLDYGNLDRIHNGSEAMRAFPEMENLPRKEQLQIRKALHEYCKLDTLAMVKVWEKLREAAMTK